jgi:DNA-binding transcriptional LysR family regulator
METKYLESFVSVVDHGSFAEAARRLNLTPAALAARVHTLEEDIGVPLIARSGRSVRPTEAGIKIVERAKSILKEARDISAIAKNDEHLGELRMGVGTSTLADLTPAMLKHLYARYPTLTVYIESGASTQLYNRVVSHALDAAVMVEPVHPPPKGFEWQQIKGERLVVLAPARLRNADPHELLQAQPFLRFDRTLRGGQIAEAYLRRHRLVPNARLEIDMLSTIAYLVRDGLGVSLVPDWAPKWVESIGVARLELRENTSARNMGLFWNAHGANAPLVRHILKEAKNLV